MKCKQLIEFYGLRRSGNHAIVEWIKDNIDPSPEQWITDHKHIPITKRSSVHKILYVRDHLIFINEANLHCNNKLFLHAMKNYETVIVGYEDCPLDFSFATRHGIESTKLVLLREVRNLAASRFMAMEKSHHSSYIKKAMRLDDFFCNLYEEYLSEANVIYEKWLIDPDYRKTLMLSLGYDNKTDNKKVADFGGGSSFSGLELDDNSKLLSRHLQVELTPLINQFYNTIKDSDNYKIKFSQF